MDAFYIFIQLNFGETGILISEDFFRKKVDLAFFGTFRVCYRRCWVSTSGIFKQTVIKNLFWAILIKKSQKFEKFSKSFNQKIRIKPNEKL